MHNEDGCILTVSIVAIFSAILAFLGSSTFGSIFLTYNAKGKMSAESTLITEEARSIHVATDNSTITKLLEINEKFFDRVGFLESKVWNLEESVLNRKSAEVDLQIRVKRLEQVLNNRDEMIVKLQEALVECKKYRDKLLEEIARLEERIGST